LPSQPGVLHCRVQNRESPKRLKFANGSIMTLTLSRSISSCASLVAPVGLPPVSAEMNSILRPAMVLAFSFSKTRRLRRLLHLNAPLGERAGLRLILKGAACAANLNSPLLLRKVRSLCATESGLCETSFCGRLEAAFLWRSGFLVHTTSTFSVTGSTAGK
jgi:hypothetical protein